MCVKEVNYSWMRNFGHLVAFKSWSSPGLAITLWFLVCKIIKDHRWWKLFAERNGKEQSSQQRDCCRSIHASALAALCCSRLCHEHAQERAQGSCLEGWEDGNASLHGWKSVTLKPQFGPGLMCQWGAHKHRAGMVWICQGALLWVWEAKPGMT